MLALKMLANKFAANIPIKENISQNFRMDVEHKNVVLNFDSQHPL